MIFIVLLIITLSYFIFIISLIIGFSKIPLFKEVITTNYCKFTIIIPFRNEAENIYELAKSLEQIDYPKNAYEIVFINDASNDNSVPLITELIIKNTNWKLLDNIRKSNSPKKDAIQTAINQAKHHWIITTDADCEVPKKWLQTFSSFINENPTVKMIAAPVSYKVNNTFLHQFQSLDFLSLIGTTIGSFGLQKPFMCNGANLCYHKQAFIALNGFENNNHIASGDDVFLLEKFNKKYLVAYLKSVHALVITKPENNFKSLVNQRISWASKTTATKSSFGKMVGIVVLLMNLFCIYILVFGLWTSNFSIYIFIFFLKLLIDAVLLKKTYQFTQQKLDLKYYVLSSLVYPFFVVYVVVKSLFVKVSWKGRKV